MERRERAGTTTTRRDRLHQLDLPTSWGPLRLLGGSRAGEATLLLLPQFRLALEAGRPHRALVPMSTVCVSHGHADHIGGLGYWASQRFLNDLPPARVLAPEEITAEVEELLRTLASLEGGKPYAVTVEGIEPGEPVTVRRDVDLVTVRSDHWVPTQCATVRWHRRRLREELADEPRERLIARREAGEEITRSVTAALLSSTSDSGAGLFAEHPELLGSEVLVAECTFLHPDDRDRAREYGHLHLEDLAELAPRFRGRHLVIVHVSRKHRIGEAEELLAERLEPALPEGAQLHHMLVDWA